MWLFLTIVRKLQKEKLLGMNWIESLKGGLFAVKAALHIQVSLQAILLAATIPHKDVIQLWQGWQS